MNKQSVFHLISDITKKEGVSCVLIGGFAVNYHKVTRQTADVDFLMTKGDFDKVFESLKEAGYKNISNQENFEQLESSQISLMNVDFVLVEDETLREILESSHKMKIVKQEFFVPCLEHLIALKLHAIKSNPKVRLTRDLPDIINLVKINKVAFKDNEFKALCLKYSSKEIYDKILEALV